MYVDVQIKDLLSWKRLLKTVKNNKAPKNRYYSYFMIQFDQLILYSIVEHFGHVLLFSSSAALNSYERMCCSKIRNQLNFYSVRSGRLAAQMHVIRRNVWSSCMCSAAAYMDSPICTVLSSIWGIEIRKLKMFNKKNNDYNHKFVQIRCRPIRSSNEKNLETFPNIPHVNE